MEGTIGSKRNRRQDRQSGQILIFMAFVLVALIGMAGLAMDGGRLYFEYRDVQNATDAAIQAAIYAKCANRDIIPAAFEAAEDNGLDLDGGTKVWVFNPPISGPAEGNDDYVQVAITSEIDPYFIQVVYHDRLTVSAQAVGRCVPDRTAGFFRGAIFAGAGPECNNSVDWAGATSTIDGAVHSNNDIEVGGGGHGNFINGHVTSVTGLHESGAGNLTINDPEGTSPDIVEPEPFPDYFHIEDYRPDYDHPGWRPEDSFTGLGRVAEQAQDNGEYVPYVCSNANDSMTRTWLIDNGYYDPVTAVLKTGIYYSPCHIKLSSMDGMTGSITFVAEGTIELHGNNQFIGPSPYEPSLLAFSDEQFTAGVSACVSSVIKFNGPSNTWNGVLYAPKGLIDVAGADNTGVNGALIGYTVSFSGADNYISWNDSLLPPEPPRIGIAE